MSSGDILSEPNQDLCTSPSLLQEHTLKPPSTLNENPSKPQSPIAEQKSQHLLQQEQQQSQPNVANAAQKTSKSISLGTIHPSILAFFNNNNNNPAVSNTVANPAAVREVIPNPATQSNQSNPAAAAVNSSIDQIAGQSFYHVGSFPTTNAQHAASKNNNCNSSNSSQTRFKFVELCTIPYAFNILKNFHLKVAQQDAIFSQTFNEKETQENDKHSAAIHKACQDGAAEQQISLLVNSHLAKQEDLENAFKGKYNEHLERYREEYEALVEQLYSQRFSFAQETPSSLAQSISLEADLSNANISMMSNDRYSNSSAKSTVHLCLGMQKKRMFTIQIVSAPTANLFAHAPRVKHANHSYAHIDNFVYGENRKNAVVNFITSLPKFQYTFKKFMKFRFDLHFPSFADQFANATAKKGSGLEEGGEISVTRHSSCGKADFVFSVLRKEENKRLDLSFLKTVINIADELQIKKIIIPMQLIVTPSKDIKANTEVLREFCSTLKRELQVLAYDTSLSQNFLKKITLLLPMENTRTRENYEKIKELLLQLFE